MGRSESSLQETANLIEGASCKIAPCDIRNAADIRQALEDSGIDALHGVIANAGVGGENHYGENDRWDEIIGTNLTGSYNLINESLPLLNAHREEGEYRHIVFISSVLARLGVPGYSAYCASKAGILGMMRSMANEYASKMILVNAICPGWVSTAMAREGLETFAKATGKSYDDVYNEQMAQVPLGRMSEPREIAELVFFLLSRVQASMTGQTIDINNGSMMP